MRVTYLDFSGDSGIDCKPRKMRPIGDCGCDCFARVSMVVPAHGAVRIPLGFGMVIPEGCTAYMHNRGGKYLSGLSVGDPLVDLNYRGEVSALMHNITDNDITVEAGERPCSLVLVPNIDIDWVSEEEAAEINELLNGKERGDKGFGSSGK